MKKILLISILFILSGSFSTAQITIKRIKGGVELRHGVSEEWVKGYVGDLLTPDITMKTGKNSSVTILSPEKQPITIPELTILEVGDLRRMSQEELLLKLAMEDVRSIPPQENPGEMKIPNTTIIHGKNRPMPDVTTRRQNGFREMEVRGTKVLYDNAFYPTCILRAKEMIEVYPELKPKFEFRAMIAGALERTKLRGQALNEYLALSNEKLTPPQKAMVDENIRRLKQR